MHRFALFLALALALFCFAAPSASARPLTGGTIDGEPEPGGPVNPTGPSCPNGYC